LKRDREEVLESYASATVETLEELSPEQRNKLYKILKLRVVLRDDGTPEVSGARPSRACTRAAAAAR
jgi:hypothetical protein